jgi:hypothetical protein
MLMPPLPCPHHRLTLRNAAPVSVATRAMQRALEKGSSLLSWLPSTETPSMSSGGATASAAPAAAGDVCAGRDASASADADFDVAPSDVGPAGGGDAEAPAAMIPRLPTLGLERAKGTKGRSRHEDNRARHAFGVQIKMGMHKANIQNEKMSLGEINHNKDEGSGGDLCR